MSENQNLDFQIGCPATAGAKEQVLEIREGCTTSEQMIKSRPFSCFLNGYKAQFIDALGKRDQRKEEAEHRVDFIKSVSARDFLNILENPSPKGEELDRALDVVKFLDGAFHHFRTASHSRLVRLKNEVVNGAGESPDAAKEEITEKAAGLSDLILETRRKLLQKVGLDKGVRRSRGLDAAPNVTAAEISGHYFNLPNDYVPLSHVPLTIAADIRTGVDYSTPANKRAYPFFELDHNPLNLDTFDPEEWVAVPLRVGAWLIVAYIHKSRGSIEMEPGLLNLFPFAKVEEMVSGRQPDGIFVFGDPYADPDTDLGYYWDKKNDLLIGLVPNRDDLKYFGYCKKPILTLHNVLAIRSSDLPLHCGCTRYVVGFEENGDAYIDEMLVKADDMGRAVLRKGDDGLIRPIFYGTETGAFACLDGFSEQAKMLMLGREVGYNKEFGSNARQIVPVSEEVEVVTGDPLDILLYANNFTLIEQGGNTIQADMKVEEAIDHFRQGERVAAGSTQTHRGSIEISYWANPFPLLQTREGEILHPETYEQFKKVEADFMEAAKILIDKKEFRIGIAYSQLMAGTFVDYDDSDIERCGYQNREEVEMVGPTRLAEDMIDLIKNCAKEKRERLGGSVKEVSITVALVGDSRTGKSETAEKMEGVLGLQLI